MLRRHLHRPFLLAAAFTSVALAGCSGRYPVSGKVTYDDGSPLREGTVIGEATVNGKPVAVQGAVRSDGSFEWGGDTPGDGALPGEYKVLVMPPQLGDAETAEGKQPAVDGKFTRYQTSGLTFRVEPKANTFDITVTRPKPKGK